MTVTLNRNIIRTNFRINEELVENLNSYKYLGVYISSKMQWNETIDYLVGKANRALDLLERNFSACSSLIKENYILLSSILNLNTLAKFGHHTQRN